MSPKELRFSVSQLILVGQEHFTLDDFSVIESTELDKMSIQSSTGSEEVLMVKRVDKNIHHGTYVSIYFEEGERYPYSDKIIDTDSLEESDNPRSPNEIELNDQSFILIDVERQRIYLSDQRKKNKIAAWLNQRLKKEILIKPLIVEQDFIESIESLSEISLTSEVSSGGARETSSLSEALSADLFGFGAEKAVLKLAYKNRSITSKIREKLNEVMNNRKEFEHVTIVGRTVNGFESVFNTEEIVFKIQMNPARDSNTGKFIADDVFASLIVKIIGMSNGHSNS